jgi:hypothetical protein
VIIGALSIGTSIAILLFVSNLYGIGTWLPASASEFASARATHPSMTRSSATSSASASAVAASVCGNNSA